VNAYRLQECAAMACDKIVRHLFDVGTLARVDLRVVHLIGVEIRLMSNLVYSRWGTSKLLYVREDERTSLTFLGRLIINHSGTHTGRARILPSFIATL